MGWGVGTFVGLSDGCVDVGVSDGALEGNCDDLSDGCSVLLGLDVGNSTVGSVNSRSGSS